MQAWSCHYKRPFRAKKASSREYACTCSRVSWAWHQDLPSLPPVTSITKSLCSPSTHPYLYHGGCAPLCARVRCSVKAPYHGSGTTSLLPPIGEPWQLSSTLIQAGCRAHQRTRRPGSKRWDMRRCKFSISQCRRVRRAGLRSIASRMNGRSRRK